MMTFADLFLYIHALKMRSEEERVILALLFPLKSPSVLEIVLAFSSKSIELCTYLFVKDSRGNIHHWQNLPKRLGMHGGLTVTICK